MARATTGPRKLALPAVLRFAIVATGMATGSTVVQCTGSDPGTPRVPGPADAAVDESSDGSVRDGADSLLDAGGDAPELADANLLDAPVDVPPDTIS
jgi:hypothetical protein